MLSSLQAVIARVMKLRPVRVFQRYSEKNGPILAGGLSLTALYSVFAGLYVGFAVLGLSIESNPDLKDAVVNTLSTSVPGLIDTGSGGGAIDLEALFKSRVLGWSSIIAAAALLVTALSWFASARSAVRAMFDLAPDTTFFLLLKLRDLALVVAFAAVTILSAALSVFSTSALNWLFGLLGIDNRSTFAITVARIIGLLVVLALDTLTLAVLFRVLLAVRIPWQRLLTGALLGGLALGILKVLGATIVGGAGKNPLLASFAVILGLLVWFGLICQVILLSATWISVDMADHGQTASTTPRQKGIVPPGRHPRPRVRPIARLK
ncbi:YihY/virulence factor BrkB family protein [Glaciihabitans sp. INWT7]|uniref:YihY/virulence factor BrkB family protein n=1 Tax=Glaciihabitans sp. INWT7 TaxID=2596912 RepID=UPI00162A4E33|nr:YhjD/YihY/BrkB family envelope integrity protein [Glaciihabitans sp. INWT7]QNE45937.1 YihY/virulence factor BrkB family protein [Glaciihabitans sp. INWT7]